MSSLGEFLNAMVALREQKAKVEEYNANQRIAGMEALGSGIGGLLGGLGKGMETRQNDALANQLRNQAYPPRAQAVNPALQGAADTTPLPGQASYTSVPMSEGGPFTGGVKGLNIQTALDKTAMGEERLRNAGELTTARISNYGSMEEARAAKAKQDALEIQLKQEREDRLREGAMYKNAQDALKNATPDYQKRLKETTTYTQRMPANIAAAAGAKDQASYDKAVSLINSEYMAMQKLGYKIGYPEIPIPAFQREAGQALQDQITRKQAQYDASWFGGGGLKKQIEEKQAQLKALGDYNYQAPGLQEWQIPEQPTRPSLEDFLPGGSGYQGPAQAPQQGPAPGGGGGGMQTISEEEALKLNPNFKKGTSFRDKSTGTYYTVQ
jgi:hypothetical protein